MFGLSGCGGGGTGSGAGAGGGEAAQSPGIVSDPAPSTPQPTPPPLATPSPGPAATNYVPNYVPNLAAARRWERDVVTVRVASPTGGPVDPSPLVQEAIDLWNHKVGQEIQFRLVSGADASPDVTVDWVPPSSLPNDAIGRTQVQFRNDDQTLVAAQIAVVETLSDSFKVQVVAHELGHAMGIDGHSANETDLMYANSHLPAVVTPSDQNTVLWSYEVGPTRSEARHSAGGIGSGIGTLVTLCGEAR